MTIELITLNEYLSLDSEKQSEYNFFMKYSIQLNTPVDHFRLGDLTETQSFGMIKDLQHDISRGINIYKIAEYLQTLTKQKIINEYLDKICQQWKYIVVEIQRIINIENIALAYYATNEEKTAGIDKLNGLGIYLQFRNIAREINLTIDQVKAMPYLEAFTELVTQKKIHDYEKELIRIRSKKK
jgi:hypothetical protein